MPYLSRHISDGSADLILHVGSGVVHGFEVLSTALVVQDLARTTRITHIAADLTEVTQFNVSAAELRAIAAANLITARLAPHGRVVVVAPEDHVFGLARMWSVFVDDSGWLVQVCRDRSTAESWLGLSLAQARGVPIGTATGPSA